MRFLDWLRRLFSGPVAESRGDAVPVPVPKPTGWARAVSLKALPEDLLQFPSGGQRQVTDLVVGLDFGTSSCKVAIQSPYKLGGRIVLIPFGDVAHSSSPYFLPATVHQSPEGALALRASVGATARRHLKLALMDHGAPDGAEPREEMARAAEFLGLVLRETRRYFLLTQRDSYGSDSLRWSLNLGIPSAGYDDNLIRERFAAVARAAWRLSLTAQPPTLELGLTTLAAQGDPPAVAEVGVVPEVAAQAVGYAKSLRRREGLHVLLDVGASTLDLCAFILHGANGEDEYNLLTADVRPLGLLELHRRRRDVSGGRPPFHAIPTDLVAPMPDWPAGLTGPSEVPLRNCDEEFAEAARKVMMGTLLDLKLRRHPHSPCWSGRLPFFVCGGGARSLVVTHAIQLADRSARTAWGDFLGLETRPLPLPDGLGHADTPQSPDFLRLSVAYGLSFPEINIGQICPPWMIEDVPTDAQPPHWQDKYVSKDQV